MITFICKKWCNNKAIFITPDIKLTKRILFIALITLFAMTCFQEKGLAQGEEVTSSIRRYREYEASTGYYEEYEVLPKQMVPNVTDTYFSRRLRGLPLSRSSAMVRNRSRLADSHQGIKFYKGRRCDDCHRQEANDIHTTRANITCRQCHGGEPVASIKHYFSIMNPIRKHAYICAKCHEGSSASFASYIIHEPLPSSPDAQKNFPALYYAYWFMFFLFLITLGFFIPHSVIVGISELLKKRGKGRQK